MQTKNLTPSPPFTPTQRNDFSALVRGALRDGDIYSVMRLGELLGIEPDFSIAGQIEDAGYNRWEFTSVLVQLMLMESLA